MTRNYWKALNRQCVNFLLLCIVFYSPSNFAADAELAGRVVAVSGEVNAIDTSGSSRQLRRRSEIFPGDVIVTQASSFAQIRMTDSAIVSLKELSQFEILEYSFNASSGQDDISTMRLIEGGFRTITGSIGEQNRDAYTIETEYATIGIRGTDHEASISDGVLFTGVYDGGTTISNDGGSLNLGFGADYDFAQAINNTTPPQGLVLLPAELGNIPVLNIVDAEQDGDDDSNTTNGNSDSADDTNNAGIAAATSRANSTLARPVPTPADSQTITGVDNTSSAAAREATEPLVNPNETQGDGALSCSLNSISRACRPEKNSTNTGTKPEDGSDSDDEQKSEDDRDPDDDAKNEDDRNSDDGVKNEDDSNSDDNAKHEDNRNSDDNAKSEDNRNSDDNAKNEDKPKTETEPEPEPAPKTEPEPEPKTEPEPEPELEPEETPPSGADPGTGTDPGTDSDSNSDTNTPPISTVSDSTIQTLNISWGSWDNPIQDNWVIVRDGGSGQQKLETSNYVATVNPTPVANLQGSGSYASSAASSFIGSGSAGNVTQVAAGLKVDFDTGQISNGLLVVEVAGSQAWEIGFSGNISGGIVKLNALSGTLLNPSGIISNSIEANLGGVFTGAGAEAFLGGFDLIDELNQFNQVDGLYTIER